MSNEDEILKMYTSTIDLANYYDSVRDIDKTLKYSFLLCLDEKLASIGIIKIIYWCSKLGKSDKIFELFELIRNNDQLLDVFKESFLRENKISFKNYLLKTFIKIITNKEHVLDQIKNTTGLTLDDNKPSYYMTILYKLMYETDLYSMYNEIKNEKNNIDDIKEKCQNLNI